MQLVHDSECLVVIFQQDLFSYLKLQPIRRKLGGRERGP